MYYLVQFTEDNIYEICNKKDIKGRHQKFCSAKWQCDKNFYPAKILVSGTKKIVGNLFENLNNGLPKVLLSDVSKLLAEVNNKSNAEQKNISEEEDLTDHITDGNLIEEYMICNTHPLTDKYILKENSVMDNITTEHLPKDKIASETYIESENHLREKNLFREEDIVDNVLIDTYIEECVVPETNPVTEKNLSRRDSSILDNKDSNSVKNYLACDKCSQLIEENHFTSHNLEHNQGRCY